MYHFYLFSYFSGKVRVTKYISIVAKNMEYNFTSVKLGAATQLSKHGRRFMLWLESLGD